MAYGKHNNSYPPPAPAKVARPAVPSMRRPESSVGGGGHAAPTRVPKKGASTSKSLSVPQKWSAPSSPVNQPNKGYRG